MDATQEQLVDDLVTKVQVAAEANAALAEFERTHAVRPNVQFRPLNSDAVARWRTYVAAVKAGQQSVETW